MSVINYHMQRGPTLIPLIPKEVLERALYRDAQHYTRLGRGMSDEELDQAIEHGKRMKRYTSDGGLVAVGEHLIRYAKRIRREREL
jgi:hypothetical protein